MVVGHLQSPESPFAGRADFVGQYTNSSLRPVPNYVLRPRLHRKIKEQLHDPNSDGEEGARILVVWGLGGSGKSQLVLKYIREYQQDYTGVFWIEAGSKETIERDYVQIYRLLYGRQTDAGQEIVKVEDAVPAVKRWFQSREGRWLVILDSADTIDNDQDIISISTWDISCQTRRECILSLRHEAQPPKRSRNWKR